MLPPIFRAPLFSVLALNLARLAAAVTVPIEVEATEFNPANVTITTADDVIWLLEGPVPLSLAQDSSPGACQKSASPVSGTRGQPFETQGEDSTFRMGFTAAGQYPYFSTEEQCRQGMWGVITVIPVVGEPGPGAVTAEPSPTASGADETTDTEPTTTQPEAAPFAPPGFFNPPAPPAFPAAPPAPAPGAAAGAGGGDAAEPTEAAPVDVAPAGPPGGPAHAPGAPGGAGVPPGFFPGPFGGPGAAGPGAGGPGAAGGAGPVGPGAGGPGAAGGTGPAGPGPAGGPGPAEPAEPAAAGGPGPAGPGAPGGPGPAGHGAPAGGFPAAGAAPGIPEGFFGAHGGGEGDAA